MRPLASTRVISPRWAGSLATSSETTTVEAPFPHYFLENLLTVTFVGPEDPAAFTAEILTVYLFVLARFFSVNFAFVSVKLLLPTVTTYPVEP